MKNKVITAVFSVCLVVVSFLTVIDLCCFDKSFYDSEHEKLTLYGEHLPEYIGTDKEGLAHMTDVLLDYLRDPEKTLDLQMEINGQMREIFTDDEKSHMVDVRILYLNAMKVRNVLAVIGIGCLVYLIVSEKNRVFSLLKRSYSGTLIVILAILLALGIAIYTNFDAFWTTFHHIFFRNDLWLLNLRTDILIMIVPPDFFNHLCIRIFFIYMACILFFFILFSVLAKKEKTA